MRVMFFVGAMAVVQTYLTCLILENFWGLMHSQVEIGQLPNKVSAEQLALLGHSRAESAYVYWYPYDWLDEPAIY
ncbi:MAG: hypothetical protein JWO00_576 [Candidatus Parcubacteria bacterium]|nr:hypothetical protein [Candidatus Parcubacteria bacterium]